MGDEWRTFRLGDVCTKIGSGATPRGGSSVYLNDRGPFSLIRSQNIHNDGFHRSGLAFIGTEHASELNNVEVLIGDVLLNITGDSVARCCQVESSVLPARVNQHVAIIRPNPKQLDCRFLRYFIVSYETQTHLLSLAGAGATRNALTKTMIESLEIFAPKDVQQQRAITHILGTLDDKIELNRRMNETLEAMARALFKSWFVDFEPVRIKQSNQSVGRVRRGLCRNPTGSPCQTDDVGLRDEAANPTYDNYLTPEILDLFPDSFEDSELGEVPKGWRVQSFAETIEIIGGGTPKTSVAEYWDGDIPWFSVVDAPTNTDIFVVDTQKKITQVGLDRSSTKLLPEGTTIISARGTVGRLALVGVPMAMNQSCYGLRSLDDCAFFTYYATRTLIESLKQRSHGSVFDTITRDTLAGITIVVPSNPVKREFEVKAEPIMQRIKTNMQESRTLATLRDTLLPKLLSGEIRVKDAEKMADKA